MRRPSAFATIAVTFGALLALPGAPASAKGSELKPDRPSYEQGQEASLHVVFGRRSYDGTMADGPFYGYLVRYPRWFLPGPIPRYATPLGPIRMRVATGRRCCFLAKMDFVVPSVPDGTYAIEYCNDPCTIDGIGDLEPSPFWIGETARRLRLEELRSTLRETRERATDTRLRLHRRIRELRARRRVLAARVEELDTASVAIEGPPRPSVRTSALLVASSAAALGLALLAIRRSRRRS